MIGEACSLVTVPHVAVLSKKLNGPCSTPIEYEMNIMWIYTIDKIWQCTWWVCERSDHKSTLSSVCSTKFLGRKMKYTFRWSCSLFPSKCYESSSIHAPCCYMTIQNVENEFTFELNHGLSNIVRLKVLCKSHKTQSLCFEQILSDFKRWI